MRHVLVATDFSEVADNAVHYACNLAKDHLASVTVLHSFIIPVTFSDTPMPVMPVDEGRAIAEERMSATITALSARYPGLLISSRITFGEIIDSIEECVHERAPWLIILGNSGLGDSDLWFGSNVVSALRNLKHPVMAVPAGVKYKKPENVCFACDFTNIADHFQIEALGALIREMHAQLHVLNVDFKNKHSEATLRTTELHQGLSALDPVYHYVEKEHIDEGIRDFVEANHMDWLIIVPHKHSFWEGLFHKSHTKALVKLSHIPIVALHERAGIKKEH